MSEEEVNILLEWAKKDFQKDLYLLEVEINERSLTHKFAESLQKKVGTDLSVDCEYNRYGTDPKVIEQVRNIVGSQTSTDDLETKTIYPDIIIHKRGTNGPNILVIEAKKNATEKSKENDINKLRLLKKEYKYNHGVFINFNTVSKEIVWQFI